MYLTIQRCKPILLQKMFTATALCHIVTLLLINIAGKTLFSKLYLLSGYLVISPVIMSRLLCILDFPHVMCERVIYKMCINVFYLSL